MFAIGILYRTKKQIASSKQLTGSSGYCEAAGHKDNSASRNATAASTWTAVNVISSSRRADDRETLGQLAQFTDARPHPVGDGKAAVILQLVRLLREKRD